MADSTGLSWYQDPNTLALGSLGLGVLGTGLGAYSNVNTANQQNQLRNAALNTFTGMTTPAAMTGQGQQYYNAVLPQVTQTQPQAVNDAATTYFNAGLPQVNAAAQNLLTQNIAPIEGMRGYDPRSGQGQLIYSQAVAPLYYQAWADAVRNAQNMAGVPLSAAQTAFGQAQGAQSNALGALGTATPNINAPAGSVNALPNALQSQMQSLAMMQALQSLGYGAGGAGAAAKAVSGAMPSFSSVDSTGMDWSTPGAEFMPSVDPTQAAYMPTDYNTPWDISSFTEDIGGMGSEMLGFL